MTRRFVRAAFPALSLCCLAFGCSKPEPSTELRASLSDAATVRLGIRPDGATTLRPDESQLSPELRQVFEYIDAHTDDHVLNLQTWIQQPGIAETKEGVPESAQLVKDLFDRLKCQESTIHEVGETEWGAIGSPVVYARCDEGAPRTLLMYWMYDTLPVTEPDAWTAPPFAGVLRERPPYPRVLIGRGASRAKGPQMVMWNTLMSIKAVAGKLPVNVIAVAGGDGERLSIGVRKFVKENVDLFRGADALWAVGSQSTTGRGSIQGASEGFVAFELRTSGERWGRGPTHGPIHGRNARAVDNPAWRHMRMLDTLVSGDGYQTEIEGFYDDVKDLTEAQQRRLEADASALDLEETAKRIGVPRINMDSLEYLRRVRFGVSINVDAIWGGNTLSGAGGAIVPNEIISRHTIQYVPNQDGLDLVAKIRRHLDRNAYEDVDLKVLGDVPWCEVELSGDLTTAQARALDTFGIAYTPPDETPARARLPYWPAYLFGRDPIAIPISRASAGRGGRARLPDEYYVIEGAGEVYGMAGAEKLQATVLYNYAGEN